MKTKRRKQNETASQKNSDITFMERLRQLKPEWLLMLIPLLAMLPMLISRMFPFVAPNEEPKWAVLVVCGLLTGLISAWCLWQRKQPVAVIFSLPGLLLGSFLVLLGLGIFMGPNPVDGLIRYVFWLVAVAVFLVAVWAMRQDRQWLDALIWATSIAALVFSLGYWWSYVLDFGKPGYNVSVLFSPIGHVNFTGDVLVVLLPALTWMLVARANPILRVMNWFSVVTIATVLLVAASRGALGGLAVGVLLLAIVVGRHGWQAWKSKTFSMSCALPALWVVSALLTAFIVNSSLPYHYRELVRLSGTIEVAVEEKTASQLTEGVEQPPLAAFWASTYPVLTARTPMYASAMAMALDAPLLGQGTGSFPFVYPAWSNRFPDFRDPLSTARTFTTNPHNIVLQLASQNGFVATLLFLSLPGLLWFGLLRSLWREWHGWRAAGLTAITAAGFDAMFNHVFYNPASMFVFALFAGAWWGSLNAGRLLSKSPFRLMLPWTKTMAVTLAMVTVLLAVWPLRWVASEWHVGQAMAHARQPAIAASEYQTAYALNPYNFRAVFGVAQSSYAARKYDQAIAYLKDFELIYPYNPPALNMLGAAYMMKRDAKHAADAFERALKVLPGFEMAEQNLARIRLIQNRGSGLISPAHHRPSSR